MSHYDLVVIGGGTGGLVSAPIAAGAGAPVALIERERTGGDCLWTGCVPSKSLIGAAGLAHRMRHADTVGPAPVDPVIDFSRVMEHVRDAIRALEPHNAPARLRGASVELIEAHARFAGPVRIEAGGRQLRWRAAIVATGSRPRPPAIPGLEEAHALNTDSVWDTRAAETTRWSWAAGRSAASSGRHSPGRARVCDRGAGRSPAAQGRAARERTIASRLEADGVDVRVGCRTIEARTHGDQSGKLSLADGRAAESVRFDRILVAAGRAP